MTTRRKTAAQLNREIEESLAKREGNVLRNLNDERRGAENDQRSEFTAGFNYATTPANRRSLAFTSGARAAGEALGGWIDEAQRVAKHFGLSAPQIEALIKKTRLA